MYCIVKGFLEKTNFSICIHKWGAFSSNHWKHYGRHSLLQLLDRCNCKNWSQKLNKNPILYWTSNVELSNGNELWLFSYFLIHFPINLFYKFLVWVRVSLLGVLLFFHRRKLHLGIFDADCRWFWIVISHKMCCSR